MPCAVPCALDGRTGEELGVSLREVREAMLDHAAGARGPV